MLIADLKTHLKVNVNKKDFYFEKSKLYQQLLTSELLGLISLSELKPLFIIGIPNNIKDFLKQKIQLYKDSFTINSFIYKDKEYWLDSKTRGSLCNLSKSNLEEIEFILGDQIVIISPKKLQEFLSNLEIYAYKCHVNTFKHLKAIESLDKLEEIFNYDYTTGYPEKIILE